MGGAAHEGEAREEAVCGGAQGAGNCDCGAGGWDAVCPPAKLGAVGYVVGSGGKGLGAPGGKVAWVARIVACPSCVVPWR